MKNETKKIVCDHCGEMIYQRSLHIENFQHYDLSSKGEFINKLMQLENVPEDVALSWAEHGLYEQCIKAS